jgi:hypothetical protein
MRFLYNVPIATIDWTRLRGWMWLGLAPRASWSAGKVVYDGPCPKPLIVEFDAN